DECAFKKGLSVKNHFSLQDLITGMIEQKEEKIPEGILKLSCPNCGMTFKEFRESGRFGCCEDYNVFQEPLMKILDRIHGSSKHTGKIPLKVDSNVSRRREIIELKSQLDGAVQREDYELAAKLRDKIKEIEGENPTKQNAPRRKSGTSSRVKKDKHKEGKNES
ncbi:MAG: UvrB/UvrC motif-containing protein, partial [Planctomycetota bacterium]